MEKTIVQITWNLTFFLVGEFFGFAGEGNTCLDEKSKSKITHWKHLIFVIILKLKLFSQMEYRKVQPSEIEDSISLIPEADSEILQILFEIDICLRNDKSEAFFVLFSILYPNKLTYSNNTKANKNIKKSNPHLTNKKQNQKH